MEIKQESTTPGGAVTWMAGNSVAANLLMLVLLVGGFFMATKIKQEVFPEYELGIVNVSVAYPGASPEEVERGIILAIEEAVQGLDGLDEIRSTALEGRAVINLEVIEGVDVRSFAQEVESQINAITSFPDEAEDPMVSVVTRRRRVISFAVFGTVAETVLRQEAEALREMLLQDPAITQVEFDGVRDYEIHIEVSQANLRRYDLTLAEIATIISKASVDLPGGSLKTDGGEILVRMKERRESATAYGKLAVITLDDGTRVLLEDIAFITEGFEDTNTYATFNGQPAIMLEVYRVGDQKNPWPWQMHPCWPWQRSTRPCCPVLGLPWSVTCHKSSRKEAPFYSRTVTWGLGSCLSFWPFSWTSGWPSGSLWAFPSPCWVPLSCCP